jgi:hypothetical protein
LSFNSITQQNVLYKNCLSQARSKNQFRNLRSKVLKCCANIYFNHQYLKKNLTPNYPKIKMPSIITKQILLFLTETNNFIIVFQFDNTMECPLPKKKLQLICFISFPGYKRIISRMFADNFC